MTLRGYTVGDSAASFEKYSLYFYPFAFGVVFPIHQVAHTITRCAYQNLSSFVLRGFESIFEQRLRLGDGVLRLRLYTTYKLGRVDLAKA